MLSGARIDTARPRPSDIRMRDIAAHLAKRCMYHGATHNFYSEAQHAAILAAEVAKIAGEQAALYALLHAADDAVWMPDARAHGESMRRAIHEAIDLDWPVPVATARTIAQLHARLELAEMQQLLTGWDQQARALLLAGSWPLSKIIKPLPWDRALDQFIDALRGYAVRAGIRPCPALVDIL